MRKFGLAIFFILVISVFLYSLKAKGLFTKTYTNYYMGYSIKHPYNWSVRSAYPDDKYDDGSKVDLNNTHTINLSSPAYTLSVSLKEELMNPGFNFEENAKFWMHYYLSSSAELGGANTKIYDESITLGDKAALKSTIDFKFTDTNQSGRAVWIYVPINEKHLLSIKYSSNNSDEKELKKIEDIVNTLNFQISK